jgi:DNA-binding MarR family transcriptional regulator
MDELDHWATGRLLSAAARLVEHEWNSHLAQWDLNHASLAVLHVLLGGPQTQRDLAAAVQVEDQTMSRTVERLERSGYVERRRDAADRRRVVVTLTPTGRSTCLRAGDLEVAEGFFAAGVDDVEGLRRALTGVIRALSRQRWPGADHPTEHSAEHPEPSQDPERAGPPAANVG